MKYIARRLLHGLFVLAAASILSFLLASLAPGDFFSELRLDPRVSVQTVEGLRHEHGLDRPLLKRYASWVASAAQGDFGYSLAYNGPVGPLLGQRMRGTLLLTGAAVLASWLLAIPLGIWSATQRGTWRDSICRGLISLLLSIPELLLAIVFLVLAVESGWFPAGGMMRPEWDSLSAFERVRDVVWHLVLPVTVLVLGMLPVLVRHTRAAMIEVMDSAFAVNARAQGIPRRRLLVRHLLPAAAGPLVGLFGLSFGTLLSASLLLEVVMSWPGLGPLFLEAIMARDFALVVGVVMLSTALLITGNLVADVLLYRLDPRIRMR